MFVKQLPMHPRVSQTKKLKRLTYPKNRMKNKELQIARENAWAFMTGKFSFSLLNKTMPFDVSRVDKEKIMDKTIENWPSTNDEFYIIHEPPTNSFFFLDLLQEAKNMFEKLKTDPKSVLFFEEKIDKRLLKKLKR